jgi:hypothetical protein
MKFYIKALCALFAVSMGLKAQEASEPKSFFQRDPDRPSIVSGTQPFYGGRSWRHQQLLPELTESLRALPESTESLRAQEMTKAYERAHKRPFYPRTRAEDYSRVSGPLQWPQYPQYKVTSYPLELEKEEVVMPATVPGKFDRFKDLFKRESQRSKELTQAYLRVNQQEPRKVMYVPYSPLPESQREHEYTMAYDFPQEPDYKALREERVKAYEKSSFQPTWGERLKGWFNRKKPSPSNKQIK